MKKLIISLMALILSACSRGTPESNQGQWKPVSYSLYGSPSNQTPTVADVETSIVFDSKRRMSSNIRCNDFGSDYSIADDTLTFGPIMSTLMFCEGPVGDQEMRTLAVFQGSATFEIDGNKVTITSPDGFWSIVLERK